MLSLCFSYVATIASPFRSSVFYFLTKLSEIGEENPTQECKHIQPQKR